MEISAREDNPLRETADDLVAVIQTVQNIQLANSALDPAVMTVFVTKKISLNMELSKESAPEARR